MPEPKLPKPTGPWARSLRTLLLWGAILLLPLLLLRALGAGRPAVRELSYSQFSAELARGRVAKVVFLGDEAIEGELRAPEQGSPRFRVRLPPPALASERLLERLDSAGVEVEARTAGRAWSVLGAVLPWIVILGFWLLVLRQMQASGAKAFQFGRSRARLVSGEAPKVTFADVAGAEEAKEELREVVEFLKDPKRFSRLGARIPKGVLLVGPPGTGKTLLARAVAGEAGRPFFSMSGSDFVEMFVGVGAARVRDLFEQGKANAPCIIFIDEIDAVGRHRGAGLGGGHDEREQTLNQLLVEMDGFETNEGVIVLAATNRPDVLDPALLRPGRFDRQVVVDAPDLRGREEILRVHLRKVPTAPDVDVAVLARSTPGLCGADLANIVNEAALLAARRGKDRVDMRDLEQARDKVMLGAERKSLVLSEAERRLTAYHEAGHAVIALRHPGLDPLHKVTIVPRGRALGVTASLPEEDRHSYAKDYLMGLLIQFFGGRVAEELVFGPDKITTGAGNDIERATDLARRMVTQYGMSEAIGPMAVADAEHEVFLGRDLATRRQVSERMAELVDAEVKRLLEQAYAKAREILQAHRDLLDRIAHALLERETLERDDIERLARGEPLPPPTSPAPAATKAPSRREDEGGLPELTPRFA